MSPPPVSATFAVIVPVKPPARGKSRLDALTADQRRDLAAAFARDTVAAAMRTPQVTAVLAVTDDFRFAADLRADGCTVIPDGVSEDLNAALRQAAADATRRWPQALPVAVCADLPCLTSQDLGSVLSQVRGPAFVRDAAGSGTTLYAAPIGQFDPAFGTGSAERHVARGAQEVGVEAQTLRLDVDDRADLAKALAVGVGPHTTRACGHQARGPQTH